MRPFDLEKALAGDLVVTRDGREVDEIFFSEKAGVPQPVIAHIKGNRTFFSFYKNGRFLEERIGISKYDLSMAPKVVKRWINICIGSTGTIFADSKLYESKDSANSTATKYVNCSLLKTVPLEVEE